MGIRRKEYGDACATARTEIMSDLARGLSDRRISPDAVDWLTETFVATIHRMPPWALRVIADATDPALHERPAR